MSEAEELQIITETGVQGNWTSSCSLILHLIQALNTELVSNSHYQVC